MSFTILKRILILAGLMVSIPALGSNASCPSCALYNTNSEPTEVILGSGNFGNVKNAIQVASRLGRGSSPLSFPKASSSLEKANWEVSQDLPGVFQRPWSFPKSDFDPTFRTSYWNEAQGPLEVPSAPWNLWF